MPAIAPTRGLPAAFAVTLALLTACGGESPTAPAPPTPKTTVQLTVAPAFVGPLDTVTATAQVTPAPGDTVWYADFLLGENPADTVHFDQRVDDRPFQLKLHLIIPYEPISAVIPVRFALRTKSHIDSSAVASFTVGDTIPPKVVLQYYGSTAGPLSPLTVWEGSPGDELVFAVEVADSGTLSDIGITFGGRPYTAHYSFGGTAARSTVETYRFLMPDTAGIGDSVLVAANATDLYGHRTETAAGVLRIVAPPAPAAAGARRAIGPAASLPAANVRRTVDSAPPSTIWQGHEGYHRLAPAALLPSAR